MAKTSKKRVLLTREDNGAVAKILAENGVEILELPLIKVSFQSDFEDIKEIFSEMGRYDWITFSSANGVKGFFKNFLEHFDDIRSLGFARIACVGEATARELKKYFLRADVIPEISTGESMAHAMSEYETLENLKVLCVVGNLAGNELFDVLEKNNAIVDSMEVYKTDIKDVEKESDVVADFKKGGANVVVFSSPSAVESFAKNAEKLALSASATKPKVVSIGVKTSVAVKKFGMKVAAEAKNPTPQAVADAVMSVL